jgi:hypothetical protein
MKWRELKGGEPDLKGDEPHLKGDEPHLKGGPPAGRRKIVWLSRRFVKWQRESGLDVYNYWSAFAFNFSLSIIFVVTIKCIRYSLTIKAQASPLAQA